MQKSLLSISISLLSLLSLSAREQNLVFPDSVGCKVRYSAMLEMKKGYLSGICILANDGEKINGCLFNEFGISAIDFVFFPQKKKVKLISVIKMIDKWYIKKILKKDLVQVMEILSRGESEYSDNRYKIDYHFKVLKDEIGE